MKTLIARGIHRLTLFGVLLLGLVSTAQAAPQITARLNANPPNYSGKCPATIRFDGEIGVRGMTKGPLTVTYEFIRSDGAKDTMPRTLTFQKDGTQPVSTTWTLGGDKMPTFSGWQAVKVTAPTLAESNRAMFNVKCAPAEQKPFADNFRPEEMRLEEKPHRKLPPRFTPAELDLRSRVKMTPNVSVIKVDLTCEIKGYYDQAMTRPLPMTGNLANYHLLPQPPTHKPPYYVFFDVIVKNGGLLVDAANVSSRVEFISQVPPPQSGVKITPPETLSPGESIEHKYYYGPFGPGSSYLYNKVLQVRATVDHGQKVAEDNEGNNTCFYPMRFVSPYQQ